MALNLGWHVYSNEPDTSNFGPRAQQYLQGIHDNLQANMSTGEFLTRSPGDQRDTLRCTQLPDTDPTTQRTHPQDSVSLSHDE